MGEAAVPKTRESIAQEYAKKIHEITTSEPLNKAELFDLLSEILWKYAEFSAEYDMWDAVFNSDDPNIKDLLTKLFVIDSKWLHLTGQDHDYKKEGPSILFLELLLHIIQYINHQEDISESKLEGVIRIVNRSDNSNILNLGIPDDGVLFFKKCSRETPTHIDSALDAINHEFDSNNFVRSGNYTLSHVVTSFCEQLIEPPEAKPLSTANVQAKINAEKKEELSGVSDIRVTLLEKDHQDRLDMKEEHKRLSEKIRLDKIKKEEEARKHQPQVVDELRRQVEQMKKTVAAAAAAGAGSAGAAGHKRQCKHGNKCRTPLDRIEKNGKSHKDNYYHPSLNQKSKPSWKGGGGGSRNKQTNRNSRRRASSRGRLSTKRRTTRHTRRRR